MNELMNVILLIKLSIMMMIRRILCYRQDNNNNNNNDTFCNVSKLLSFYNKLLGTKIN